MTKRKIGRDYKISTEFWNKIKSLLPLPKPKKKAGRPIKDDKKIMSGILYVLRILHANGKNCQDFMELQASSMIDLRSGADQG